MTSVERSWALSACSQLPSAELAYPFGPATAVFKVRGKMFAAISLSDEPGRLTLKCDPDYADFLIQEFDEITPGYYMNKRHWVTITLEPTMPEDLIEELISDSYDLVTAGLPNQVRHSVENR